MKDKILRAEVTRNSHYWFFYIYFHEYAKFDTAPFQKEMFALTEDETKKLLVITAFRGSAKTTIMTMSYPLWAILGVQNKKHILILTQTMPQAKQMLRNIRDELETNELLKDDLGPFREESDEWHSYSLVIPKHKARITVASSEQSIRGIRHGAHRPDIIACDDVEDLASVKTKEGRDKTHRWITGDVIPAGDINTNYVFIGNMLHEDSLMMRLREKIKNKEIDGVYKEYPITRGKEILWPGKYPDKKAIEVEKKKIGDDVAWQREYNLRIISNKERVVHPEWIHRYDVLPDKKYRLIATGIDPAISEKETADYTAMVSARLYGHGKDAKIYILPNPVNERLDFPKARERAKQLSLALGDGKPTMLYIEDVAYQRALPQALKEDSIPTEAVQIPGQDKRARLMIVSHYIEAGRIVFPEKGAKQLIQQIIGFGSEKHDDLVDAFTLLIFKLIEDMNKPRPDIRILDCDCVPPIHSMSIYDDRWDSFR